MKRIIYILNWVFIACVLGLAASCTDDNTTGDPMKEAIILSEVKLHVTNPLPLLVGTDSAVAYTAGPDYATEKALEWTSDDNNIVTVDDNGRLSALKVGETTVRVKSKVGYAATASLKIHVVSEIIKATDLSVTPENPEVYETDSLQLAVTFFPENVTYKTLKWTSETPEVATVSQTGFVKGVKEGTAKIKVQTTDGSNIEKELVVKVKKVVPVTDITVDAEDLNLSLFEISKLNIKLVPSDATVSTLSWTSSKPSVVSIDEATGIYTVKSSGEAVITAKSGSFEKSFNVKVAEGKINDVFNYGSIWKVFSQDAASVTVSDGKLVVVPTKIGGYYRAQVARDRNTYKTTFNSSAYPILAIRMTKPQCAFDYQLDVWGGDITGGKYGNGRNTMPSITLADGSVVYYADLSSSGLGFGKDKLPAGKSSVITNVIWGLFYDATVTDAVVNEGKATFEVHWMKTFKSVDAMKAYLNVK